MADEIIVVLRVPPDQLGHLRTALRRYARSLPADSNFNPGPWAFVLGDQDSEGEQQCPNS